MPQVPTLTRSVELRPVATPTMNAQALGAPARAADRLIDASGRGIGVAADVVAQERRKARQVRLLGLKNDYETRLTQRLADWNQRTGLAAQGSIDEWRQAQTEITGELAQDLDPETAAEFAAYTQGRGVEVDRQLTFRASAEMKRYEAQQFAANGEIFASRVAGSFMDIRAVAGAIGQRQGEIQNFAERNGIPAETASLMIGQAESQALRVVIEQHLSNDADLLAKEVFDTYGHRLSAEDQAQVKARLEASSTRNEGFRIADEVFRSKVLAGGSLDEAMAEIASISGDNTKVREIAEQRLRTMRRDRDESIAEQRGAAMSEAMTALLQSNGNLDALPPGLLDDIEADNPEGRLALRTVADKLARREPIETDWETWTGAMAMIRDEPERFMAMSQGDLLTQYRPKLDDGDYQRLVGVWTSMTAAKDRGDASSPEAENFLTVRQQIDGSMDAAGLGTVRDKTARQRTEADRLALVDFEREAGRRLSVAEREKGGKLTMEDRQRVLDRLALESFRLQQEGRPAPWQRRLTIRQIRNDPTMGDAAIRRLRDRARVLGNQDPDDEVLERAVEAARIRASAETIDAILQGN